MTDVNPKEKKKKKNKGKNRLIKTNNNKFHSSTDQGIYKIKLNRQSKPGRKMQHESRID